MTDTSIGSCKSNIFWLILIIQLFVGKDLGGQYRIERYYPDVSIDSLWISIEGIGIMSNNSNFLFRGQDMVPMEVINDRSSTPTFYFQDSTVSSYVKYGNGFLLIINSRLYNFDGSSLRQFSVPVDGIDGNIGALSACDQDFAVVSDGDLWVWESEMYGFQKVAFPENVSLIAPECDPWGGYWVSDGEYLFSVSKNEDVPLPSLQIQFSDELFLKNNNIYLDNETKLLFKALASHTLWKGIDVQYKLEGISEDWIKIDNGEETTLILQTPGKKELRVRATVDNKYFTYHDPVKIFNSERPVQQWWWYLLTIPIVMILAGWWITIREKRYQKSLLSEKEKYNLRAEAMSLQNQVDQLKMNPHFIFNVLTGLQGLITLGENQKARSLLQRFASLMRYMLKESTAERIPLKDEIKFLQNYLELEQTTRSHRFNFEIINNTEEGLTIPPMLIQPLAENSVLHGFKGIDYKGNLILKFANTSEYIVCEVQDNGIGRKAASRFKKVDAHNSIALAIVEKRLQSLSKFRKGSLSFKDLYGSDGKATGTRVKLNIPL